jgi:holo-[acyl-carrier protein] synthase
MIIGIGIDVVDVAGVRKTLDEYGDSYVNEVFSQFEQEEARASADPAQRYASRFAVKEAYMKAIGTGWGKGVQWEDIEIVSEESGQPTLRLRGEADAISKQRGVTRIHVSLSHTPSLALAQVVLEG